MKKIKLFALAVCAMLSTNAFATDTDATVGIWKIKYTSATPTDGVIIGFKNDITAAEVKDLVIPATLNDTENGKEVTIITLGDGTNALSTEVLNKIETLTTGNTLTTIAKNAFTGASALKTVTVGAKVATIGESAFNNCIALATVDLSAAADLATIGDFAFGGTPSLVSIDFSACAKMKDFTDAGTPFLPSAGNKNNYLKSVTLNGETTNIGIAFANIPNLEMTVSGTKLAKLVTNAFANDAKITSLELPATCATIASSALADSKIATLTINCDADHAKDIETTVYGTTDVLTAVEFKGAFVGDIAAGAFGKTKLTSVKFAEAKAKKTAAAIAEGAFVLADAASTVEIAKISAADVFTASAFTGPTTATNKVTLNLGIIAAQPAKLVSANVGTATITQVSADFSVNALGDAQTIIFTAIDEGKKLTAATADVAVKKVVFGTEEVGCALDAAAVPANAFKGATGLKIYWSPATATKAFDEKIIQAAGAGTDYGTSEATTTMKNFLYTTTEVAQKYQDPFTGATELINNVYIVAGATAAATEKITLAKKDGDWAYGKFYNAGSNFKISKEDAIVYSAYVDASDATIYMDQLRIVNGYYVVSQGEPVVVKSKTNTEVTATKTADAHTMRTESGAATIINDIKYTASVAAYTLLDANPGKDIWAMAKPENYNLTWKKFKATITLPDNTFYIITTPVEGARLNVVWLDGSEEEATAIKSVKKVAENGAIYNLAGQKVNASYKGVVIKDGKKYIQK